MSYDGIIAIIQNDDKFVLIHNEGTGNITFPAGAREGNEDIRKTLKREVKEETGLKSEEYEVIDTGIIHEFTYNKKKEGRTGLHVRQKVFLIKTKKWDLKPEDPDSSIHGWFTKDDVINKLTFNDAKKLFKKVIKSVQ